MSIDLAPILSLSRQERLMVIQAIVESLKQEEEMEWEPSAEQKERLEAISSRARAGEQGKSWEEVKNKIMKKNGL